MKKSQPAPGETDASSDQSLPDRLPLVTWSHVAPGAFCVLPQVPDWKAAGAPSQTSTTVRCVQSSAQGAQDGCSGSLQRVTSS